MRKPTPTQWFTLSVIAIAALIATASLRAGWGQDGDQVTVIGPTARIVEASSGVEFVARVDTGAAVSSIHCRSDDFVIDSESRNPQDNVKKKARVRLINHLGEAAWVDTVIDDYVEVRNAEHSEHRYRIKLPLRCGSAEKTTIVNLNDRSRMTYRLLLGRDFLRDHFLVDVSGKGAEG